MFRKTVLGSVLLLGVAISLWAADKPSSDASRVLVEVLRAQKQRAMDRREECATVRKTPLVAARWQSGFVLMDGEWRPFESPRLDHTAQALRAAYRARREQCGDTAAEHFELARWCRSQKLSAQEYAHTLTGISLSPEADHRDRLIHLGYRQLGEFWLSPEELTAWRAELELTQKSLAVWGENLALVAQQLQATGRKREAANRVLDQLRDATAVPAIEWQLCGRAEPVALVGIDRLRAIDVSESTQALCRQAVFSPFRRVRAAAAEALIDRQLEDFVPALLSVLSTPLTLHVDAAETADRGALFCNFVIARETENQFQIAALNSSVQFVATDRPPSGIASPVRSWSIPTEGLDRVRNDLERGFAVERLALEKEVAARNERTEELNGRIRDVLQTVSGEDKRETPRDWWDWWDGYNEYGTNRVKSVRRVTRERKAAPAVARNPYAVSLPGAPLQGTEPAAQPQRSCLVAGTPVWTDQGPKAVETLAIGDMLLTQDLETGELKYLPVLKTTERMPVAVTELTIGQETITGNGAHRFWVSGRGWRRVKDLQPGDLLHTATGTVALSSLSPRGDAAVYNVVVTPTHNYFVGTQGLLTHDVTVPKATNRTVPGLVEP